MDIPAKRPSEFQDYLKRCRLLARNWANGGIIIRVLGAPGRSPWTLPGGGVPLDSRLSGTSAPLVMAQTGEIADLLFLLGVSGRLPMGFAGKAAL